MLWCRKTEALSEEDWRRGFEVLEHRVREAARDGETAWPPSYAEFLGLCEKPVGSSAHKYFEPLALEDKTAKEKRRELGLKECARLKGLFD